MSLPDAYQPVPRLALGEHTLDDVAAHITLDGAPLLLVGRDPDGDGVLLWLYNQDGEPLVEANEPAENEAAEEFGVEVEDEGFGIVGVRARRATALAVAATDDGAKIMSLDLRPLLIDAHLEDGILMAGKTAMNEAEDEDVGFDLPA